MAVARKLPVWLTVFLLLSACQVGLALPTPTPAGQPTPGLAPTSPPASPPPPTVPAPTLVSPPPLATHVPLPIVSPDVTGELAPTGPTELAQVVRVVDGDTIIVRIRGDDQRLRYIGIDTPEAVRPGHPVEWMGPEASAANARLVDGRTVVLEKDVSETDRFGRLLRHVWLQRDEGWVLVNHELVRLGFAQVTTYPPDVKYAELFLAAQREARDAGRGLWAERPDQ